MCSPKFSKMETTLIPFIFFMVKRGRAGSQRSQYKKRQPRRVRRSSHIQQFNYTTRFPSITDKVAAAYSEGEISGVSKHFENTESSVSSFSRGQQSIVSLEESGDDIDEKSDSLLSELQSDDSMDLSDEALQSGNVSDDESLPHSADDEENESGDRKISDEHEDVSDVSQ